MVFYKTWLNCLYFIAIKNRLDATEVLHSLRSNLYKIIRESPTDSCGYDWNGNVVAIKLNSYVTGISETLLKMDILHNFQSICAYHNHCVCLGPRH